MCITLHSVNSPLRKDDFSRDHGAMTSDGRSNPNENNPNIFWICSMRYSSMPLDCCWRRPPPPSPNLLSSAAAAAETSPLRLAAYSNAFLSRPLNKHVPGPSAEVHRNTPNDLSGMESLWPDDNRTATMIPTRHHLMADMFDVKVRLIYYKYNNTVGSLRLSFGWVKTRTDVVADVALRIYNFWWCAVSIFRLVFDICFFFCRPSLIGQPTRRAKLMNRICRCGLRAILFIIECRKMT